MDIREFQDDGNTAAIAAEWGVDGELLKELEGQWEIHETTTSDGMVVAYHVEFDPNLGRETLDALGVPAGQFFRHLSLNFNDQPDPEDPNEHYEHLANEYKRLGGRFGAIQAGEHYLLNPWYPDSPAAEEFWRNTIGEIPVADRMIFLRALARHGV